MCNGYTMCHISVNEIHPNSQAEKEVLWPFCHWWIGYSFSIGEFECVQTYLIHVGVVSPCIYM